MLIDRGLLRSVGSFRSVRKYVDAQLLHAVGQAGAAIYRTHGLGYLLRRNASGHTWQVDMDYLLDPVRVAEIRPGFAPAACSVRRLGQTVPDGSSQGLTSPAQANRSRSGSVSMRDWRAHGPG